MEESERDTEHRDTELLPKRGATSVAWAWFGYEKSDTDQKTKISRRPVATTGSNTTNLFYRLRKNHVKQYGESTDETQKSTVECSKQTPYLQEAFARVTPFGKESRR